MKGRVATLLALAALAAGAPVASATTGARLAETAGTRFPDRAYALVLPQDRALSGSQVHVMENGRPVDGVTVTSAAAGRGDRFGVVLALDVSTSMRGRPLAAAVVAAREFIAHRGPTQPVAVVTFAGDVRVLLPFTTDAAAIDSALAAVGVRGGGTHIFDATSRGIALIRAARMPGGSVVLLSDGGDRGSSASLASTTAAARRAGARVYTIGLKTATSDFGTLNLIAAGARGEFSPATSLDDLARVYDRLGARLAHQYLVQYRSTAGPGTHVHVTVRVDGLPGLADTAYSTPATRLQAKAPFKESPGDRLLQSRLFAFLLSLLVAALLTLATWQLLRGPRTTVRERMAAYVGPPDSVELTQAAKAAAGAVLGTAERRLVKGRWWSALTERLDIARIDVAPVRLVLWVTLGTLALFALLLVVGGPVVGLLALLVPYATWQFIQRKVARQRAQFADQLPDNLQIVASAMRAGHSFPAALAVVVQDAAEPTQRELRRVIADERLGVPLEEALKVVVRRMESRDLEQVALVAALQRETGGNTAEVLDRVTDTVRERLALRRSVETLTAQGRLSRWVLTALPVVLLLAMTAINPQYTAPLFGTTTGHVALVVAGVMLVSGSLVIKRIVNIKV